MSATYAFLPWLRRGMATAIKRQDGGGPTGARAQIDVAISLNDGSLNASTTLSLFGPGEITGLDPQTVIRTWPRPDVYDAASNYFPLIEFDQADLPWRYTPARPDDVGRLRPWLCLIALKEGEYQRTKTPDARHPLPTITVASAAFLPKVRQSWAWAHVQVSGVKTISPAAAQLLASEPKRLLARLLCPRRLEAKTPYTAFVVPTFKRGVLAGLGEQVPETVDALEEAWGDASTDVELPVYYQWGFQSGEDLDFEALVRKLKKEPPPSDAGKRYMDVSQPGAGRVAASSQPLGLEGTLKIVGSPSTTWLTEERTPWVNSLKELVDLPTTLLTTPTAGRRVAPSLYGRWHAARTSLDPLSSNWFDELNADPRLRVIAAIGVRVVQAQQEQLMASAWRQVEGIRAVNEALRQAQLAREIARRIHARHIAVDDTEAVLQLTGPVHGRVREAVGAGTTVRARITASPIPVGLLAPQWRRIARPWGPMGRRQGRAAGPRLSTVLARLGQGELQLARPPKTPSGMVNLAALGIRSGIQLGDLATAPGGGPSFLAQEYRPERVEPPTPPPIWPAGGQDSPSGQAFRDAVVRAWPSLTDVPLPVTISPLTAADLQALKSRLVKELDPEETFAASYKPGVRLLVPQNWSPADPLEPVMAAPQFPQPMIEPLRELSQEWLFPGLDKVPPNSMTLLAINHRFIYAYMLGLNFEMARELLWNEYPTDQRGTYFRQFWDPAGYIPRPNEPLDPKKLEDIDPIDQWLSAKPLETAGKQMPLATKPLVLLLRGDLLARYPNALVYAVKAETKPNGDPTKAEDRTLSTPEIQEHPVFGGTLKPDVAYFAFNLPEAQVLGDASSPAGWYFVLQEQPSEARFGLNATKSQPLKTWDNLSWDDLGGPLRLGAYIDLDANAPPTLPSNTGGATWAKATNPNPSDPGRASDMAFITLQRQVRIAVHGSDMIP